MHTNAQVSCAEGRSGVIASGISSLTVYKTGNSKSKLRSNALLNSLASIGHNKLSLIDYPICILGVNGAIFPGVVHRVSKIKLNVIRTRISC